MLLSRVTNSNQALVAPRFTEPGYKARIKNQSTNPHESANVRARLRSGLTQRRYGATNGKSVGRLDCGDASPQSKSVDVFPIRCAWDCDMLKLHLVPPQPPPRICVHLRASVVRSFRLHSRCARFDCGLAALCGFVAGFFSRGYFPTTPISAADAHGPPLISDRTRINT